MDCTSLVDQIDELSMNDCNDGSQDMGAVDDCGVCRGDNTTCSDCDGVPNGPSVNDACGVCDGDNSTCADCSGVPNGSLVNDVCGVCDGDGSTCATRDSASSNEDVVMFVGIGVACAAVVGLLIGMIYLLRRESGGSNVQSKDDVLSGGDTKAPTHDI